MVAEEQLLTAEEAAQLFGTSLAEFIARVEKGMLPLLASDPQGRFRLQDLRVCQEKLSHMRREKLAWMTEQGQQERLDELSGETYREVLEEIRHGR